MSQPIVKAGKQHGLIYRFFVYGTSLTPLKRNLLYMCVLMICLLAVWAPITAFLTFKQAKYTSEWTLILPGTGNGLALNLENIGQATASSSSPYTNSSVDPVVNYKSIASSMPVLSVAADQLGMSLEEFGLPKIKLVDQTSLMHFRMTATNAEEAQQKAYALYEALQSQLDLLRDDETHHLSAASMAMLADFNQKLELAQQEKVKFQVQSEIVSFEQYEGLITLLEQSKHNYQQMSSEHRAIKARIYTLGEGLYLDEARLRAAIALRNDTIFQKKLARHAEIHAQIAAMNGIWGEKHPQMAQLKAAHREIERQLMRQGRRTTRNALLSTFELIELGSQSGQNQPLIELLTLYSEMNGLQQQIEAENEFINELQEKIRQSAEDSVALENLSRKQQVATAVFSTALAKLDISSADRFSSYPLVQMLASPTLPQTPDRLHTKLALVGGIGASLATSFGLLLMWIRKPWLQKILKNV
ncbi:hypothetical protein [Marinobacter sp. CA1]|uniref:hypothetical protein n=1 Tax=Marinobacter sp. CA1 TaxID=2817656 RepID=UPI001D06E3F6|nr:hypothetical protein [Marinobacter sp. CA1]UDL07033.1 hypothetical protein J2887_09915 [Marinobacter sp. CA1]